MRNFFLGILWNKKTEDGDFLWRIFKDYYVLTEGIQK